MDARVERLADRLTAGGVLTDEAWARALHAVPRHLFAPGRGWFSSPQGSFQIDRAERPEEWWEAVYAPTAPLVTQVEDGMGDPAAGEGVWTSSLSAPDIVVLFLELLGVRDHDRVLEVGTGTGWTAGLLSYRVGAENVTSIEVDPALSADAAANLAAAGQAPRLLVGDGELGDPDGAPYDRVHVTCGVRDVPYAWIEQTRPGGVIVLPWMPAYAGGHRVRLTVLADGTAVGTLHGGAAYMMLRSQRSVAAPIEADGEHTATRLDPRAVIWESPGADVVITALLPGVTASVEDRTVHLRDGSSWAAAAYRPGRREYQVRQAGERRLWDEVAEAYLTWIRLGRPARERFGLTISERETRIWLDDPSRPVGGE